MVIKVNLNDINGVLPKDAWSWVQKRNKQSFGFKSITTDYSVGISANAWTPGPNAFNPQANIWPKIGKNPWSAKTENEQLKTLEGILIPKVTIKKVLPLKLQKPNSGTGRPILKVKKPEDRY
jgi:hypothetical protein